MKSLQNQRLNKQGSVPLYHQLRELLREKIEAGKWKPGDRIPTENELCEKYQVSKTTVRQALNALAIEGKLCRKQGRGTYVAESKIEHGPIELTSFTEEMGRRGMTASSKVLELDQVPAVTKIARKLELPEGELVSKIKRLRLADGIPMGIQTTYLPDYLFPDLQDENLTGSLYKVLKEKYGVIPTTATETYFATTLDDHEAELLEAPTGNFIGLAAERVAYSQDGRPIEFVHSVMRGDRYQVTLQLVKRGINPAIR